MLPSTIFNTHKADYENPTLILGDERPGLLDSINKQHPSLTTLYKQLKAQDWDEFEFPHTNCLLEFKTCSEAEYNSMIDTIAWQWETDTAAARTLVPVMAPFVTSSDLWKLYSRIGDNEVLHSLSYSEIVANSFERPDEIIADIMQRQHAFERLKLVADVYGEAYQASHEYALELIPNNQDLYDIVFKFLFTTYVMESVQFMSSFAVTFSFAKQGRFSSIGDTVQKICVDELLIHVKTGEYVLDWELRNERGMMAFNRLRDWIVQLIMGVVQSEYRWTDRLFQNGNELTGVTRPLLYAWVNYRATKVFDFMRIPCPESIRQTTNPLPWMDDWTKINNRQHSPQEQRGGNYVLGGFVDNLGSKKIVYDLG